MINKLIIHNTASYKDRVEIEPSEVNYFYGSNGTGKTSLGNVIDDCSSYDDCSLEWKSSKIETLVYNKNFVNSSFSQSNAIEGIFTLGKDETKTQTFIKESNIKIDTLTKSIDGLKEAIEKQESIFDKKKRETINKAWQIKLKYEEFFKPAYEGFIRSGEAFFNKCINEIGNTSVLLNEDDIKDKCRKVFNDDLKSFNQIKEFEYPELNIKENSKILSTKIIGKEDVEIGKLIKKLDNSDWIKDGVDYLKVTENQCPFCQQEVSKSLKNEIESFFDETYENKKLELNDFIQEYKRYVNELITNAKSILEEDIIILEFDDLKNKIELLEEQYKSNVIILKSKQKTPSIEIELKSLEPVLKSIASIIKKFREEIETNNKTVKNITKEKDDLKSEIWQFVLNELKLDLRTYTKTKEDVEKAKGGMNKSKKEKTDERFELQKQVNLKESEITSVLPTVNEINKILTLFGFTNFKLDESERKGFYKIVREDGAEVNESLSEGEYTFITFLYFYHLLKGSKTETGIATNKVVVIDDPISSLDSNVLFVVSNLIKEVVEDVKNDNHGVKQIFILTHNVYFYKEVTFLGSRHSHSNKVSFWIVRKLDNKTKIIKHPENPIKTTYELLWRELDDIVNINTATIFNTLRRILEYYFNILGGLDYEEAISKFEGEEQIICKSLVSWINDGSHFINDDLVVFVEPESIEKYLKVFKDIFNKMGHVSHYNMMRRLKTEVA